MALKTLQCCGNASSQEQKSALSSIHTLNPPPRIHPQAWRVVTHPFGVSVRSARPHVGRRGPFLPVAAMIVVVVMNVVFCAEPTEILKNAKYT